MPHPVARETGPPLDSGGVTASPRPAGRQPAPRSKRGPGLGLGLQLMLLSIAAGCMDVLSYLELGEVFTSAMTGNAVLLGLAIGRGSVAAASRNLAAMASFLLGLALAAALLHGHHGRELGAREIARALLLEELLLIAFATLWLVGGGPISAPLHYALIALSAVAMGTQSALAHHIGVPGMATTYFTGTLTNIVTGLIARRSKTALTRPPRSRIGWQASAFLAYIGAAALAGVLATHGARLGIAALALPALPAIAVALALLVAPLKRWAE